MENPNVKTAPIAPVPPKFRHSTARAFFIGNVFFLVIYGVIFHTSAGYDLFSDSETSSDWKLNPWEGLQVWLISVTLITLLFSPVAYFDAKSAFRKAKKSYDGELKEWETIEAARCLKEEKRTTNAKHRDADFQTIPYQYEVGRHGNVTLAIRYGIANYRYVKKGQGYEPAEEQDRILIKKISKIAKDKYLAKLPDFNDREVHVIIEPGTEFVKTFYPLDEVNWFKKHQMLEQVLKDNKLYSIAELARLHVEKVL